MRTAALTLSLAIATPTFAAPNESEAAPIDALASDGASQTPDAPGDPQTKPPRKVNFEPGVQVFSRGEGRITPDFAVGAGAPGQDARRTVGGDDPRHYAWLRWVVTLP